MGKDQMELTSKKVLEQNAFRIRMGIFQAVAANHGGHVGGSLDLADMLAVVYSDFMRVDPNNPLWENRDFMVFSKGHAGPALYSTLAWKGFITYDYLNNLNKPSQAMPGHCDRNKVCGVDVTSGSLGQGLSIAAGIALASKVAGKKQRVFCVTGDGESAEGQIWEAAQFASHYKLNNLVAFLDHNNMQIDGTNDEVMTLGDAVKKYESFGWNAVSVSGTDVLAIQSEIYKALHDEQNEKPTMIVLETIKGQGSKEIMEMANNHCIGFPDALKDRVLIELAEQAKNLEMEDYFNEQQIYWK